MALPLAGAAAGYSLVSGYIAGQEAKRIEEHIQDRVQTYQTFTNEKLQAIIDTYGGEMGEAARRVLATRPAIAAVAPATPTVSGPVAHPPPPPIPGVPSSAWTNVEGPTMTGPGTYEVGVYADRPAAAPAISPTMLLVVGGAALLLLFALRR